MTANTSIDSEKLLYKLILQFSIFNRGSNNKLDPHLANLTKDLKQGKNYQNLTPELLALSKALATLSRPEQQVNRVKEPSAAQKLQKDVINRLNELLPEADIPIKFQRQYSLIKQKSNTDLDEQGSKKIIDLALSLLIDIKDHAVSEQQGLEAFLNDLSTQFSQLEGQALDVSKSNEQSIANRESLSDVINQQINNIKDCTENALVMSSLKENINEHVQELSFQFLKHQKIEIDRQLEATNQLDQMSQKMKDMEIEADTLRNNLKTAHDKALRDILTGLPNRMAYDERAKLEYHRWSRYKAPLALIIWDIDLFKQINDNYGHKAGDKTLAMVAQLISKSCRETDFIARYGGEEFVMLLPNTTSEQALIAAEKIRPIIAESGFNHNGKAIKLTISCGISQFLEGDQHDNVFERADQALYLSKEQGRNKCSVIDK